MHYSTIKIMAKGLTALILLFFSASILMADGNGESRPAGKELQQRIDFGNVQILGQSIKSGAVYLMHRKQSDIRNMIKVRQDYRAEIKEDFGFEENGNNLSNASDKRSDEDNNPK
jgi:hypothetical protein